ncbi:MAG TPA: hypothetical protein VM575_09505 [Nocardioides sp.]|jgi:hypothetical protein|nr:hypothetical protein [Nocardioides sp.]
MRRSQLAVSFVLALSVAGAGGASMAAEGPPPAAGDAGVPSAAVDSDRGAVDRVGELVTAFEGAKGFARAAVDYDRRSVAVLWKGQPPAGLTKLAETDPDGVDVTIDQAEYSEEEIRAAGMSLMNDEIAAGSDRTITATYADEASGALVVEVDSAAPSSARSSATKDRYSKRVGNIPVTIRAGTGRTQQTTRQNDYAPYKGGAGILLPQGAAAAYCTTGFAITMSNGTGRLLTAGHCGETGGIVRDASNQGIGYLSSVDEPTWDSALVDPTASPATTGVIYGGGSYNQPGSARYMLDVAGGASPLFGQEVCTGGANSGEHGGSACTGITVTNTSINVQCGAYVCNTFRITSTARTLALASGDSGGPVYIQRTDGRVGARGVIMGGDTAKVVGCPSGMPVQGDPIPGDPSGTGVLCFWEGYAISIPRLLNRWNATLETN